MSFREIALATAQRGIAVYPTEPGERGPKGLRAKDWTTKATTDPAQIEKWAEQWPDSNCICVSNPATSICLDIDNPELADKHDFPFKDCEGTLQVRTPGGGLHIHFLPGKFACQLETNKGIKLDGELSVEYKYKSSSVAAPGSTRADGGRYQVSDKPLQPIPNSVILWLLERVGPPRNSAVRGIPVDEDFDFDELTDFFGIDIIDVSGVWNTPRVCPIKGDNHTNNGKADYGACAFAWDEENRTLGWKDHAQTCEGADKNVKQVIEFLEEERGEDYPHPLFAEEVLDDSWIAPLDSDDEAAAEMKALAPITAVFPNVQEVIKEKCYRQDGMEHVVLPPVPKAPKETPVAAPEPDNFTMPEDCMYGWLGDAARKLQTPLSMAYPAMLAVASATKPKDARGHVRSNLYVALLGGTGSGKTVTMRRAEKTLLLPEKVLDKGIVASDRGLIKRLGNIEGGPRLLYCSELLTMMLKAKIENSALAPCLCDLFDDDIASISDKQHTDECNAALSILGALKCDDGLEFTRIFGTGTGAGLADRFILGLSPDTRHEYKDLDMVGEFRSPKGLGVPSWCFSRINEWRRAEPESNRSRIGEIALRVALVSAALNHEETISKDCLEAAIRFAEWQERIRQSYRIGLAETKDAECSEAILGELNRRGPGQRVHWAKMINSKGWYRRFGASMVSRTRDSLVKEGVLSFEKDEDTKKPTGYVTLRGRIK